MTPEIGPWSNRWRIVEAVGKGGQGHTYRVEDLVNPGQIGLLKILKHQDKVKARSRMRQEVVNLDIIGKEGVTVPLVLDGNTEHFSDLHTKLYFVMQYIEGETLENVIKNKGRLTVEQSVAVTRALCKTVADAHDLRFIHRDLKPGNVMVRDLGSFDLVIVDFGLSFNEVDGEDLTETEEGVGNRFLVLPESGPGGTDKRDKRSDVTQLIGMLYYCLTTRRPEKLRDQNNMPPHRRPGGGVRDVLGGDPRTDAIELLLERGFQHRFEDRFQTCQELLDRLERVLIVQSTLTEAPEDVAARLSARLLISNRKTQLGELQNKVEPIIRAIHDYLAQKRGKLGQFNVASGAGGPTVVLPTKADQVTAHRPIVITLTNHSIMRYIWFVVGARGQECELFVSTTTRVPPLNSSSGEWKALMCFDPNNLPAMEKIHLEVDVALNAAMESLHNEVSTPNVG